MATLLTTLQSRRKNNGTYPVVIRIRHDNRYFDIQTGIDVQKSQFDTKQGQILGNRALNFQLEELKAVYAARLRNFQKDRLDQIVSLDQIKKFILRKEPNEVTVSGFWNEEINKLISENRGGSARTYKNTLSVLQKLVNMNTPFSQISVKEILTIEEKLRQRGNSYNSIAVYLRTFKAICNKAIDYQLVTLEWYPFKKYKIKKEKTIPKVLSIREIQQYFKLNPPEKDPLYRTWNIGKLLFLLRGINLRDLLFLTNESIKGDRIIYRRGKTGKIYSIKLHEEITKAFDNIKNERVTLVGGIEDELYKFPNKSLEARAQVTKRINTKLKKIGHQLGFKVELTTYVFRYTYANVAKKLGYSKDLIAEALGHEYGNPVTGIYLEYFDQDILDQMNKEIIENVTE